MSFIQQFDFEVNAMRAFLWQYNEAERLQKIVQQKEDWYKLNQTKFWNDWYRDVFDVRTANEFGLNIWSIILDVPIIVVNEVGDPDIPFGFNEATDGNFEHSNFKRPLGGAQILTREQARAIILMRYHQLTSSGNIDDTNRFYQNFFSGQIYAVDNLDMTITYVINFAPPAQLRYILENYDILPRPAGVKVRELNIIPAIPFGFDVYNENFRDSNFED